MTPGIANIMQKNPKSKHFVACLLHTLTYAIKTEGYYFSIIKRDLPYPQSPSTDLRI